MSYHSTLDYEIKNEPETDWTWEQFGNPYGGAAKKPVVEEVRQEPAPSTHVAITCRNCAVTTIVSVAERSITFYTPFEKEHEGHGMSYYFGNLVEGRII